MITTSEIKISVVVDESTFEHGVRAVHQAFELDKLPSRRTICFYRNILKGIKKCKSYLQNHFIVYYCTHLEQKNLSAQKAYFVYHY